MKKDTLVYYLYSFFVGFYIANGTTVLFARVLGFSFSRIFILGAIYMLMFVVFNVPTGALADLLGRKKVLIAGSLALVVATLWTGLSSSFGQVLASFFVWALGFSLIIGANEALLYDKLQDQKAYARVAGRAHFFWLIGTALAGVLGPFLFSLNFRFAYLFSAVPFFLGALVIIFFDEQRVKKPFSLQANLRQMAAGIKLAFQNKFLLWAVGITALSFGVAYTFSNSYQPYLRDIGFSLRAFSIILPAMFAAEALGGSTSGFIYSFLGENLTFGVYIFFTGAALFFLGFAAVKPILAVLYAYSFLQGVIKPVISTYSNGYIAATLRATVLSAQAVLGTLAAALMLFLFGFLTDKVGLNNLLMILGGLVLVSGVALIFSKPREARL